MSMCGDSSAPPRSSRRFRQSVPGSRMTSRPSTARTSNATETGHLVTLASRLQHGQDAVMARGAAYLAVEHGVVEGPPHVLLELEQPQGQFVVKVKSFIEPS